MVPEQEGSMEAKEPPHDGHNAPNVPDRGQDHRPRISLHVSNDPSDDTPITRLPRLPNDLPTVSCQCQRQNTKGHRNSAANDPSYTCAEFHIRTVTTTVSDHVIAVQPYSAVHSLFALHLQRISPLLLEDQSARMYISTCKY